MFSHLRAPGILLGLTVLLPGQAQQAGPEQGRPVFQAQSTLVTLAFQVVKKHRFVNDLRRDEVYVVNEGIRQEAALFEGGQGAPRSRATIVTLIFDCSRSVRLSNLLSPTVIKSTLLDELPNVWVSIYGFSHLTYRLLQPSQDVEQVNRALKALFQVPSEGTALNEAIRQVIADPTSQKSGADRLAVIFSDGIAGPDYKSTIELARQANVRLFPVLLSALPAEDNQRRPPRGRGRSSSAESLTVQAEIAAYLNLGRATGGESFQTGANAESILPHVLKRLAEHLKADYLIGFYASHGDTRTHTAEVKLLDKSRGEVRGGSRMLAGQ